jgi:hypothetical protein
LGVLGSWREQTIGEGMSTNGHMGVEEVEEGRKMGRWITEGNEVKKKKNVQSRQSSDKSYWLHYHT